MKIARTEVLSEFVTELYLGFYYYIMVFCKCKDYFMIYWMAERGRMLSCFGLMGLTFDAIS